eukprot:scaffold9401_cov31-Tisochrysis_lutea.AAC.3
MPLPRATRAAPSSPPTLEHCWACYSRSPPSAEGSDCLRAPSAVAGERLCELGAGDPAHAALATT